MNVAACGGVGTGVRTAPSEPPTAPLASASTTTVSTTQTQLALHQDMDKDSDNPGRKSYFDADDYNAPNYPYAASAVERRTAAAVLKRYLTAAVADDGAAACSLIYSLFAETIPESYGLPPLGSPALRGDTCAKVMTKMFKQQHKQLAAELPTLEVASVRVSHNRGLAVLHFKDMPPRSITMHRERGVWKVDAVLDTEVT
jgi:hypothetical protein